MVASISLPLVIYGVNTYCSPDTCLRLDPTLGSWRSVYPRPFLIKPLVPDPDKTHPPFFSESRRHSLFLSTCQLHYSINSVFTFSGSHLIFILCKAKDPVGWSCGTLPWVLRLSQPASPWDHGPYLSRSEWILLCFAAADSYPTPMEIFPNKQYIHHITFKIWKKNLNFKSYMAPSYSLFGIRIFGPLLLHSVGQNLVMDPLK